MSGRVFRFAQHVGLIAYDGESQAHLTVRRLFLMLFQVAAIWLSFAAMFTALRLWARCV